MAMAMTSWLFGVAMLFLWHSIRSADEVKKKLKRRQQRLREKAKTTAADATSAEDQDKVLGTQACLMLIRWLVFYTLQLVAPTASDEYATLLPLRLAKKVRAIAFPASSSAAMLAASTGIASAAKEKLLVALQTNALSLHELVIAEKHQVCMHHMSFDLTTMVCPFSLIIRIRCCTALSCQAIAVVTLLYRCSSHPSAGIRSLAFSADDSLLLSTSSDQVLTLPIDCAAH